MEPVTFIIAAIASIGIWRSTPLYGLCIYFAAMLLYPAFLTLKIGPVDFNVGRILILVLYAKLILQTTVLQQFRWTILDKMVVVVFVTKTLALFTNAPVQPVLEHESGVVVTVLLPYIAIRAIITTKQDFFILVQTLIGVGLVLAVLGAYESLTGNNPMGFMKSYDAWQPREHRMINRLGLHRADVSFGNYLAFGLYFAAMLPLSLMLRGNQVKLLSKLFVASLLLVGAISSMSSAPLFAIAFSGAFLFFFPFRMFAPLLIVMTVIVCVFLEFYSNRHFYEVPSRLALDQATVYDRVGLYEEAFGGGMSGHWITGYGYVGLGPGQKYNDDFDWQHIDLLNIYINRLVQAGLVGTIPFLIMNVMYYVYLRRAFVACRTFEDQWMVWCLTATLLGWNLAMQTVGFLGNLESLLFSWIALAGCMPAIIARQAVEPESHTPVTVSPEPYRGVRSPETVNQL